MKIGNEINKVQLAEKIIRMNLLWSYANPEPQDIPDDILIEKVLLYMDIEDINLLFSVFPYKKIRKIWKSEILIQDQAFHSLNLLLAFLYFKIKRPEKYIEQERARHLLQFR